MSDKDLSQRTKSYRLFTGPSRSPSEDSEGTEVTDANLIVGRLQTAGPFIFIVTQHSRFDS
ncbi:hypothetical protein SAMN05421821_11071 [Mucilaginibacter lappiensis]|uniref:Uncharacterized protein n=1 Tax=Mucilaginibacter lappiensis TaxID=354630 RepID=A0ABR6PMQ4_9SPHI|nr:hypothetical protein [Mucilaginibacter lappiensis]SIR68117.1 hypothetical protein SAMN05421821_11071 [Mucilaginibacter lappiensis]